MGNTLTPTGIKYESAILIIIIFKKVVDGMISSQEAESAFTVLSLPCYKLVKV